MRICLLTTQNLDSPLLHEEDWPCDPRPFLPNDEWHVATLKGKVESVAQVEKLIEEGFDLFFNLCDGAADQDIPGIEVIQTLEKHGVPFTGSTSESYEPSRAEMKEACQEVGIATPKHVVATNKKDVERAAKELNFPLFVKHYHVAARSRLDRGVHRWHRVHGSGCRESRRSEASHHLHTGAVPIPRGRVFQTFRLEVGRIRLALLVPCRRSSACRAAQG